jgi:ABC-type nitrate/sulfonate/bicarbonate transport system substrate-binding protein
MSRRAELLLGGTYDYVSGLHHETYVLRAKGDKRLVYLAQAQNDWDERVIVRPEIRSAKDLEGQRFAICSRNPCVRGNLEHALQLDGVDLAKVELVVLDADKTRASPNAVDLVVAGGAAGALVDAPFDLRAERLGMHRLEISSLPVIHNATMCANREWVREDEETTLAFLRSMVDAIHFFKTRPSETLAILEEHCAPIIGARPDEMEHTREVWAALLSPKPFPHPLAVWNVYSLDARHNPEADFIGPFEVWDTSYLRTIDDSGYIEALYGGAREAINPAVNPAI